MLEGTESGSLYFALFRSLLFYFSLSARLNSFVIYLSTFIDNTATSAFPHG
jgi:hypothetical protein